METGDKLQQNLLGIRFVSFSVNEGVKYRIRIVERQIVKNDIWPATNGGRYLENTK